MSKALTFVDGKPGLHWVEAPDTDHYGVCEAKHCGACGGHWEDPHCVDVDGVSMNPAAHKGYAPNPAPAGRA